MRSALLEGLTWIMNANSNSPSFSDPTGEADLPIGMRLTRAGEDMADVLGELDEAYAIATQLLLGE